MDKEGAAAFGFAYGLIEKAKEVGDNVVQPEVITQATVQLIDLSLSALGGEARARQELKRMGNMITHATISKVPEAQAAWD